MKAHRTEAVGGGPDLFEAEPFGVAGKVFARLLESVEDRCRERVYALDWTAKPGLGQRAQTEAAFAGWML
ncbi:MAG TPA: hypothetical protein VGH38_23130 [Bryobacteraceae bacterium]